MLKRQCRLRNVEYPMGANHINVKTTFSAVKGLKKKAGMKGALHILGIPLDGTHHREIDDVRNIAKILHCCLKQK